MQRPIAVDLFAGAGGMSLGFEQAGFDVLAAVEIDPVHCAVHEYNFPNCATLCGSVVDMNADIIRQSSTIGDRDIDVVFGGPPCQGVSLMGHRALDDPRNSLMKHYVRLVLELRPRYFVMENVKGLTIGTHKQILLELIETLGQNGYSVETDYKVLNAAEYGVPQDRRRLFLLGCRQGEKLPNYPEPLTTPSSIVKPHKNTPSLTNGPTVHDAIGDIPNADNYSHLLSRDWVKATLSDPSKYAHSLRSGGEGDYSYNREFDANILTSSMRTIHTPLSIERFTNTRQGEMEPISRFPRLHPHGICNTLRAGTGSDRGAYTSPRPIHPVYPRCITVREAARLHSYPDWFRFHATKWHGFRQIGNSVPPLLARSVAGEVIKALGVCPEKPLGVLTRGSTALLNFDMTQASAYYGTDRRKLGARIRIGAKSIAAAEALGQMNMNIAVADPRDATFSSAVGASA